MINVIKAWKDADYRNSLSTQELALVAANPAGFIELNDEDLLGVAGGKKNKKSGSKKSGSKKSGSKKSGSNKSNKSGSGSGGGSNGGGGGTICMCTCFWCK